MPSDALSEGAIIDVRTSAEFHDDHINGAISLPYTRIKDHLSEIPQGKRLFVHCASGKRASLATSFLKARGFDAVHVDGAFIKSSSSCSLSR
jgi:hydroxyacylglutathione hydrolase